MPVKAVIFDLGGVILHSPMSVFAAFEKKRGLPHNFLNRIIVENGEDGAWARLERGELTLEEFAVAFDREIAAAGADISSRELMAAVNDAAGVRPEMLAAVRRIREAGYKVAALTNNWLADASPTDEMADFKAAFDLFVESSVEGVAKPDPKIYELVLTRLGVAADEAVFLDDIGRNLKPARQMGMTTIKVGAPDAALAQLETVLGIRLRA